MITCTKCGKQFSTKVTIDGKRRNIQNRKLCLQCSPFGQHNTRPDPNAPRQTGIRRARECITCCKRFSSTRANKECSSCRVTRRRQSRKRKAIKLLGGKCCICGYNRTPQSLDFHHLDPNNKKALVSRLLQYRWEVALREIKKCVVVCKNCHGEIHAGITVIPVLTN